MPPERRDRDPDGRARNARPRDRLGRPLPHGSAGVPTIPDDLVLSPTAALAEAQRLLDEGMPFHAHEVLEGTWKSAPPAERDLWQGLAQLAVGITHVLRGNGPGAVTVLRRARTRIGPYAENPPYEIDVPALRDWINHTLSDPMLSVGQATPPEITPPRLRRPT